MNKNTGKKKLPTIENYNITPILSYLALNEDNSSGIAKHLERNQSGVYVHLKNLEKEYIIKPSSLKKNAYTLNWEKILEKYYYYFINKLENTQLIMNGLNSIGSDNSDEKNIENHLKIIKENNKDLYSNKFKEKFVKNVYITEIIKSMLLLEEEYNSLKEIFDVILIFFKNGFLSIMIIDTLKSVNISDDELTFFLKLEESAKKLVFTEVSPLKLISDRINQLYLERNRK